MLQLYCCIIVILSIRCDYYDLVSKGVETDPDKFSSDWHPHRGCLHGMTLLSVAAYYLPIIFTSLT